MHDIHARSATILFVHSGRDWIRGSERCLLDLMQGLDRARFRPVLWCDGEQLAAAAQAIGATVHPLAPGATDAATDRTARTVLARQAARLMRDEGVALVHANAQGPLRWLVTAARELRIPLVAHLHIVPTLDERLFNGLHQATLVVGVSATAVSGVRADGMPASRVRVIYNGIDARRLDGGDATALRGLLDLPPGGVVFTTVGSLIERKGVDVAIRALAVARRRDSRAHLLVLGDGPERGALESLRRSLGLDGAVHFLGERTDVGAVLRDASDVALSMARAEAFPLNLLEAAYAGLPIIASAIDPHRESIVEGATGVLVPCDDHEALAAAMLSLVGDPGMRMRLGAAGRERVVAGFLVDEYVARFAGAYDELLALPRRQLGWTGGWVWPRAYWSWLGGALARRVRRMRRGATPAVSGGPAPG